MDGQDWACSVCRYPGGWQLSVLGREGMGKAEQEAGPLELDEGLNTPMCSRRTDRMRAGPLISSSEDCGGCGDGCRGDGLGSKCKWAHIRVVGKTAPWTAVEIQPNPHRLQPRTESPCLELTCAGFLHVAVCFAAAACGSCRHMVEVSAKWTPGPEWTVGAVDKPMDRLLQSNCVFPGNWPSSGGKWACRNRMRGRRWAQAEASDDACLEKRRCSTGERRWGTGEWRFCMGEWRCWIGEWRCEIGECLWWGTGEWRWTRNKHRTFKKIWKKLAEWILDKIQRLNKHINKCLSVNIVNKFISRMHIRQDIRLNKHTINAWVLILSTK